LRPDRPEAESAIEVEAELQSAGATGREPTRRIPASFESTSEDSMRSVVPGAA